MLTVDPTERFTLDDVVQHPWCIRPSQLEDQSPLALADLLTSGIKANGDMDVAAPPILNGDEMDTDEDEDTVMQDVHQSQFTQSLMLFVCVFRCSVAALTKTNGFFFQSQTQSGSRYTPHLTRFYASLGPSLLVGLIEESLTNLGVRVKPVPRSCDNSSAEDDDQTIVSGAAANRSGSDNEPYRLRVGGWDSRRVMFKGWIEIERFTYRDGAMHGSFCVMKRDEGNPMSWRALWKRLVESEIVEPHVLKKKRR
jgi:serine/threonine-protein kinase Chk1